MSRAGWAGWRLPAFITSGDPLERQALALAARFGSQYHIDICRMRQGRALRARRVGGASQAGVYAVITDDPGEMWQALLEDQDSLPGDGGNRGNALSPGGD